MKTFEACEICGASAWSVQYEGPIRDGTFGKFLDNGVIGRCGGCRVERLAEHCCLSSEAYQTEDYRRKLDQGVDVESFYTAHDELQIFSMIDIWTAGLRGKTIADIGCGGGSFLDHVKGVAGRLIAVEPFTGYHESLRRRRFDVFSLAEHAVREAGQAVDLAVTFQVIEHTENPRQFLSSIAPLLRDDGVLVVSSPNRSDILMKLLPEVFPSFFYRVVHRWYFDRQSLEKCADLAGYEVVSSRSVHRFGISNVFGWLRDRRPGGRTRMDGVDELADGLWKTYLETTGQADCLYMHLRPRRG